MHEKTGDTLELTRPATTKYITILRLLSCYRNDDNNDVKLKLLNGEPCETILSQYAIAHLR